MSESLHPKVGVGVMIRRDDKILLGRRRNSQRNQQRRKGTGASRRQHRFPTVTVPVWGTSGIPSALASADWRLPAIGEGALPGKHTGSAPAPAAGSFCPKLPSATGPAL